MPSRRFRRLWSFLLATTVILGMASICVQGAIQDDKLLLKSFDAANGVTLPYRLYVPETIAMDQPLPVLLFLHGAGERGNDNSLPLITDCELLNRIMNEPDRYPCILVIPQCAQDAQWVDTPWSEGNYSVDEIPMSRYLAAVKELLSSLEEEYSIDPGRRYITGLSMGGFGTWDMIMRYPRTFAAAIPICGGGDPTQAPRLLDIAIRTYHGSADTAVPVAGTRTMAAAMELYDAPLFAYTEIAGADHGIWGDIYRREETAEWLFAQRRDESLLFWGDPDQDNRVTANDALLALQHSVGLTALRYEDADVADVNADGQIDASDALWMLQHSVGLIDHFPAQEEPDQRA